jgi:hypothetical protein
MAHLKAREVRDGVERKQWALRRRRSLYERGFTRGESLELFRCIDRLPVLPATLVTEPQTDNAFSCGWQNVVATWVRGGEVRRGIHDGYGLP